MKKAVTTAAVLICFCMLCGFTPRMPEMFDGADLFTAEEEKRLLEEAEKRRNGLRHRLFFSLMRMPEAGVRRSIPMISVTTGNSAMAATRKRPL